MEYSKAPYSRGAVSALIGTTALIGVVAVIGLIIASILAGSNFIKQGSSVVMTNNVMHNVLSVTTNDTMPATHSHVLLEGAALVVTLPSFPLTAFKGKTFSVCNSDSVERKLVLPDGNYWMPNTEFTQILFNAGQCCVTFSVTDENRVHIVGDVDNKCFTFCSSDGSKCGTCESCKSIETPSTIPPTQDIFDQTTLLLSEEVGENLLTERVVDIKIPVATRHPEAFGYNSDGSLNVTGGDLYAPSFTGGMFRVHGVSPSAEKDIKFDDVVATIPILSDFFTSRGFNFPGPDTSLFNKDHFTYRTNTLSNEVLQKADTLVDMSFNYTGNSHIPVFLDLTVYRYEDPTSPDYPVIARTAAPYEPDLDNNRDPNFAYPIRIPVTTDCYEFTAKKEAEDSIVYYNDITRQFEISVHNINFTTFEDTAVRTLSVTNTSYTARFFFHGFSGKFQLIKRDSNNNLVSSRPLNSHGAVQVSETVELKTSQYLSFTNVAPVELLTVHNYRAGNGNYAGMVVGRAAGGSPDFDIFILDPGFLNAYAIDGDPFVIVPDGLSFGDNPSSLFVEELSGVGNYELFDSGLWKIFVQKLSVGFLDSPSRPEDFASYPLPTTPVGAEISSFVHAHEFMHSSQRTGHPNLYGFVDGEAQATGIESDTDVNLGCIATVRAAPYVQAINRVATGTWPLFTSESETPRTYGLAIFWQWFFKVHDPAHQIMRRANDLLAINAHTLTGLPDVPPSDRAGFYAGLYRLYLKQAAMEIKGLDFHDVAKNYTISMSLLRNNGAIPPMYRTYFPYWLYQPDYPGAAAISTFQPPAKYWWSDFDLNTIPSPASSAFVGAPSIMPQLNVIGSEDHDMQDLESRIYVVDTDIVSNITVTSALGRIVATVHQFERNVPDADGTFTIDGPHELTVGPGGAQFFDLSGYAAQSIGLVRLVVTNIEITDFGGSSNVLADGTDRITGKATIDVF